MINCPRRFNIFSCLGRVGGEKDRGQFFIFDDTFEIAENIMDVTALSIYFVMCLIRTML